MSADNSPPGSRFEEVYQDCLQKIHDRSEQKSSQDTGETGLKNDGNWCFANSVLQALLNTPKFASICILKRLQSRVNVGNKRGTKGAMTGCLSALADIYWSGAYAAVDTKTFLDTFSTEVNKEFSGSTEEDAHEFQTILLSKLAEDINRVTSPVSFVQDFRTNARQLTYETVTGFANEYKKKQRRFTSSIVDDIFQGDLVMSNHCHSCDQTRVNFEGMNHLSIGIAEHAEDTDSTTSNEEFPWNRKTKQQSTLDGCLAKHFESSTYECRSCKFSTIQTSQIWSLPAVLIVHLKRFEFKMSKETVKDNRQVTFPLRGLDMRRYLHPASEANAMETRYSLYAIVVHNGNASSGHYLAKVKNLDRDDDTWRTFNDAKQHSIDTADVENSHDAYMLYYMRAGMSKMVDEVC